MNKNISEEIIEIDGKEYTLFINRQGIVNWERKTKFQEKAENIKEIADNYSNDNDVEITDETNPFEMYGSDVFDELSEIEEMYSYFYWIALYTHHKFNLAQAKEIFEKAREEYGIEQLVALANQMIETANTDKFKRELKNLKALKPKN